MSYDTPAHVASAATPGGSDAIAEQLNEVKH